MDIRLPNFLIVGAAKSGTTSLWHYLKQHPEVFMPINKEPIFFVSSYYKNLNPKDPKYELLNKFLVLTFEDYLNLFKNAKKEKAIGEASVPYLYHYEMAIPQIKKYLGDVKIIIILRNPVDRAFSAYTYLLRDQEEVLSLDRCLDIEDKRKKENWCTIHFYKDVGLYFKQVKAYLESFTQVKVYLFDDLKMDTLGLVEDIYEFLDVDSSFIPDVLTRHNISGVPKNMFIHNLIDKPNFFINLLKPVIKTFTSEAKRRKVIEGLRDLNLEKPEMPPETREYLKTLFRDDILKLQDVIDKDLNHWLK